MSLRLSGGRRLQSPPGDRARPTPSRVRLAVMNMLAPRLAGCRWLDLCCGSAVMACEALQRGAAHVVALEQDRRIAQVAKANLQSVALGLGEGAGQWQLHNQEVLQWLRAASRPAATSTEQPFDLIYCDPPYGAGLYGPIAAALATGRWLQPQGLLLMECGSSQVPPTPEGWVLESERRYGSTTVLLLSCPAGCRGGTGSRQP
ncbi:MAG: 16S rRNA (guanine(966)-N(2))-methyltransferase RsmD [Cyanobacteriota bacterium]|nr:16S rRNA (guanine(966)-N(2))-methyltransferase RsmD [Cyanobacteriota bacterium]